MHAFTTLLVFSLFVFPFTLHFFFLISMLPLFFLIFLFFFSFFLFFASFLSRSFLLISLYYLLCLPSSPSLCIANALLYCLLWWILLFYLSTTFVRVWVSFPDHSLVCQLPSHHHFPVLLCHHHFPVLAMPYFIPRQKECCFVFLLSVAFPSG